MNRKMGIVVLVLSLLAALEPLSIDLYLPAFTDIAESLQVSLSEVQISLSIFLAGFAIGQLFWGTLSDYYGRKNPILAARALYTVSSFASIYVTSIEQLWVIRFLQAFGGCAGVVVGRAAVNDLFVNEQRTKVFSLLVIISGIAPVIAPTIGNLLLKQWHWHGVFNTMALLGAFTILLTWLFLPKSKPVALSGEMNAKKPSVKEMVKGYVRVMKVWPFMVYTIIGCMAYGGLMVYVSNAPFLIMEKGGMSGDTFAIIFAINSLGLMFGTYIINFMLKYMTLKKLVRYTLAVQLLIGTLLIVTAFASTSVIPLLVLVFLNLIPIGLLLPATTSLGLAYFKEDSGSASALMGFLQLFFTGVLSAVVSFLQNDSVVPMMCGLFVCGLASFVLLFVDTRRRLAVIKVRS